MNKKETVKKELQEQEENKATEQEQNLLENILQSKCCLEFLHARTLRKMQ